MRHRSIRTPRHILDTFRTVFPRQLRFWTFHCVMNALPSLGIIILVIPELSRKPVVLTAMFSAIGTFILLVTTLTSLRGPLSTEGHLLSRSLKLGAKIREWMAVVSLLPLAAKESSMLYIPDYYCAVIALAAASHVTIPGFSMNDLAYGVPSTGFIPIFASTILTGLILSFLLLIISFFAVILLQARDRRKFFADARSASGPSNL
jgi:hypothetical protein